MSDYSKGKIYKLLNTENDEIYVGSTIQPLSQRLYAHKHNMLANYLPHQKTTTYDKMRLVDADNYFIELIENYPCSTREELRAREGEWIRKIATLNKLIAGRDSKGYYDDNAELLRQKSKDYREQHKEQTKQYNKQYREANTDKIKAIRKNYMEQNHEKVLEQKKQYHIANKQKEREYKKQKYEEQGKLKTTCECGCVVTQSNLSRHLKTKRHEEQIKTTKKYYL